MKHLKKNNFPNKPLHPIITHEASDKSKSPLLEMLIAAETQTSIIFKSISGPTEKNDSRFKIFFYKSMVVNNCICIKKDEDQCMRKYSKCVGRTRI